MKMNKSVSDNKTNNSAKDHRFGCSRRWFIALMVSIVAAMTCIGFFWPNQSHTPSDHLDLAVQLEEHAADNFDIQRLGWTLAILGRDHEVRKLDMHPHSDLAPLELEPNQLSIKALPWKQTIERLAGKHRIIMIMESHIASKHREMTTAILPILKQHGFTHLGVEAIGESAHSLKKRGYPSSSTGYYTTDPQFGNLIRTALEQDFQVLGYDFRPFTHEIRETYAADQLARILDAPDSKLVIHAGLAHVLKHETELGQEWLAAKLWKKSGIEPFTIWQWSDLHEGHEYQAVAKAIASRGKFDQPVILMPPPSTDSGLRDIPRVDAIIIHPPDTSSAPDNRTPLFANSMTAIYGKWNSDTWPIVVCAMPEDEPANSVPLDQVMLRTDESRFRLNIPSGKPYQIRVFDKNGIRDVEIVESNDGVVVTDRSEQP